MKESIIKSKLSQSALNIGAGSPTDAGLSFRGETDHPNPIQIAGGIPDFPTLPISDFTKMLEIAKLKLSKIKSDETKIEFIHGDAEKLPMGDNSYDHICISFGFRNLGNYNRALAEFHRVLKPGGQLCILEFSQSKSKIFNFIFSFYFNKILPRLAAFISRADAYRYLPESVKYFPNQSRINDFLDSNKFSNIKLQTLTFGVATIYKGIKDK